jgi:hypothetical protein
MYTLPVRYTPYSSDVSYREGCVQDDDEKLDTGDTKGKFSEPSVDVIRAVRSTALLKY